MSRSLTSDDLDGLGHDAMVAADPRPVRDELVAVAEARRVEDPDDVSYAFVLAAEISQRCGELDRAVDLSGRATEAAQGTRFLTGVRATHAHLLLCAGRDHEGMTELHALRPQLTRDPSAADAVTDALVENGRAEIAEQWLTAGLETAIEAAERAPADTEASLETWEIVDVLAGTRRAVRRELGLAPDEHDRLADELDALEAETPDLVFWPRAAFETLVAQRPELAAISDDAPPPRTWDEHRAQLEQELQAAHGEGELLLVEAATPQLLAHLLRGHDGGSDPGGSDDGGGEDADAEVAPGPVLEWPPGRNDPCWCGTGTKYKKCCLPRPRG